MTVGSFVITKVKLKHHGNDFENEGPKCKSGQNSRTIRPNPIRFILVETSWGLGYLKSPTKSTNLVRLLIYEVFSCEEPHFEEGFPKVKELNLIKLMRIYNGALPKKCPPTFTT